MDESTKIALRRAVAHWQDNSEAHTPREAHISGSDCALCDMFRDNRCESCPVAVKTGQRYCGGSPYEDAATAMDHWNGLPFFMRLFPIFRRSRDRFQRAARAERDFLAGLLREAEKPS